MLPHTDRKAKRPLRVMHLIDDPGRSPYFCRIAELTDPERVQLIVGTLAARGALQIDMEARGVQTFALDCSDKRSYASATMRLLLKLRRERIDVLQTHLFYSCCVGLLAGRLGNTPLTVFTAHHCSELALHAKPLLSRLDAFLARHLARRCIAPSGETAERLTRDARVCRGKLATVPLGFDLTCWQPDSEGRARVREELGLEQARVFGAVGRLFWVKDYPLLIRAFAQVARAHSDTVLLIVGDGEQRSQLHLLVRTLGIDARQVRFLGYRSDIVAVMSSFDVFVHASQVESFGQVLIEACALGKPILSTAVGIAPEVVRDGVNGRIVSPGDVSGFSTGLEHMLAFEKDWESMGQASRANLDRFDARRMVAEYECLYRSWLSSGSACTEAGHA